MPACMIHLTPAIQLLHFLHFAHTRHQHSRLLVPKMTTEVWEKLQSEQRVNISFFWLVDNILKKWSLKKDRFLIFFPHWWLSLDPCNHWNPAHPDMNWHVVQTMLCLSIPTKPFDTAPNWELVDFHFFSCKDCCLTRQSLWWRWGTEERSNL